MVSALMDKKSLRGEKVGNRNVGRCSILAKEY